MTTRSAVVLTAAASLLLLATTTLTARATDASASSATVSKVRIVRLSEVKGQVQLDRNDGSGYQPGIANLPVVEGSKLKTEEGVAEVEFEDNSSLRLTPNSIVEFPTLGRLATGGTASTVHVVQGMAYVSLVKSNTNQFNLMFGDQNLTLPEPSHVRLQLDGTEAHLAVLDRDIRITEASGGTLDVGKKKTVTFDLLQHKQPEIAKDVAPEAFDSWDHTSVDYHSRVANVSNFNGSPYSYGMDDMMYYGSFMGGCGGGMMWRPYFASAAWDPYSNGAWAYYQGAGYSWVSPYPWGWMPYHYGSWSFCPGMGWGWMPGGYWNGLNNYAMIPATSAGGGGVISRPVRPVGPPGARQPSMLAVGSKPLVRSEVTSREAFTFRKDSAGLGVPRETFGKLSRFSQHAEAHGTANEHVYFSAPASTMQGGRPTNTSIMAGSMRRGSAPAPPMGNMGARAGGGGGNPGGRSGGYSGGQMGSSAPSAPSSSMPARGGGPVSSGGAHH
jgi:hypothetical protein